MLRKILGKLKDDKSFLYRLYLYFREGYNIYLAFAVGMLNFTVIQYNLLIERISFLKYLFPRMYLFVLVAMPLLFIIATSLGYMRYKKRMFTEEARVHTSYNPAWRKLFERLDKLERDIEEIKAKL